MSFIPAQVSKEDDGCLIFSSNGKDIALVLPSGRVIDLRDNPPFLPISPCPYCGAKEDKGHIPILHIDSSLGTKI